uniref:DUF148 domain-containing protein n=1 Tax=Heterorhabditis bacteriophora TaxID=37862 RepID=A0A1I7XRB9_HETBA
MRLSLSVIVLLSLDALIKRGQMEMAKGAFKTQLEVLEKVDPDQYKKYKNIKVEDLAADAVLQQAEMAKLQPKTGNPFVDMLNENGIPIASSLKGIEQAIKTQRELETQDPTEQIAKAVLEKFQTQILPGLVANLIAGRNPFKVPQQIREPQAAPSIIRHQTLAQNIPNSDQSISNTNMLRRKEEINNNKQYILATNIRHTDYNSERSITQRLRSSPRLKSLLEASLKKSRCMSKADIWRKRQKYNPEIAAALSPRLYDSPIYGRTLADDGKDNNLAEKVKLDGKAALLLGLHDIFNEDSKEIEEKEQVLNNLQNNPNIAPLFIDGHLEKILAGRSVLSPDQKGRRPVKVIKAFPRLYGSKTYNPIDAQVTQMIEERPIPPMVFAPKGRHTRLRWTGATEKEIPGIGGRFILPSLDPTMPAINTAYSMQGRARDEWDTIFKIPNNWNGGDEVGFSMKRKSENFVGGNGGFDMPATHIR